MRELKENAEEFLESGAENVEKKRYNVAVSDFFKAIVILCDYLLYSETRILPKNHNERFSLLKRYFSEIYSRVSDLFKVYTQSYNFKSTKNDALKIKEYAYELKRICEHKE